MNSIGLYRLLRKLTLLELARTRTKNARMVPRVTKRHGMTVKRREDPMIVGPLSPCGGAR